MSLVENTLFGVCDKVQVAMERFRTFEPPEGYYGAFSGGKDSITIKELARLSGVNITWYYQHTTVDPPELVYYIRRHHSDVVVNKPRRSMWQLIEAYGMPPTRTARYCCAVLKESSGVGTVVTGVRWEESNNRAKRRMFEHCRKSKKKIYLHPIIDWTTEDVWEFIRRQKLPYCHLYNEGFERLGCVGCPMGRQKRLRDFERWPTYKKAYLTAFKKMIDENKKSGRVMKLDWKSPQDVFDWWMDDREGDDKHDENQCSLFD